MTLYVDPKWPWVIFGDGHMAELRGKRSRRNSQGIEGFDFILNPSREIVEEYLLKQGDDLDPNGFVIRWFKSSDITVLRDDPTTGRIFVRSTFDSRSSSASMEDYELRQKIDSQQKMITVLRSENAMLHLELKKMGSRTQEFIKQNVSILKEVKKATGYDDSHMGMEDASGDVTQ